MAVLLVRACAAGQPVVSAQSPVGRGEPDELGPGGHPELGEHIAEVVVDGAPAEEQLGADLAVGAALADQLDDLELLGGELAEGAGVALAGGLAGGPQLDPGPVGPGVAPSRRKISWALRRWLRASPRRRARRSASP
jgi:hypothetical protein